MKRDPELASLLARALPRGEPRRGAEERVLTKLRLGETQPSRHVHRERAAGWWLAAALLSLALLGWGSRFYEQGRAALKPLTASSAVSKRPAPARRVEVGAEDELLLLRGGVRVLARAHGRAEIQESPDGISCRLEAGAVLVHVPEGGGQRFEVVTRTARVLVKGTVFGVHAAADASTLVTVWEGRVEVQRGEARTSVESGQHWPPEATALSVSASDLKRLAATERVRASSSGDTAPTAVAAPSTFRATAHPAPVPRSQRSNPYLRARDLELAGQRRRAAVMYERAAEEGGPSAEAALFAAARLYAGLAEHATAERLLLTYRQRHVDGEYARAADVLLLRGYVARGAAAEVEREAARFIARHPADPRAIQFRWARARQWAESGRCAEARAELPALGRRHAARLAEWCPRAPASVVLGR